MDTRAGVQGKEARAGREAAALQRKERRDNTETRGENRGKLGGCPVLPQTLQDLPGSSPPTTLEGGRDTRRGS